MGARDIRVILTHDKTDFDALASMLAAWKVFPGAIPVLPPRPNRNLRDFLTLHGQALPFTEAQSLTSETIAEVILVDAQAVPRLRGIDSHTLVHIIDHHPLDIELDDRMSFSGEPLGATTTLLVERIQEERVPLSVVEATLLLLGIYEDTGSLSYLSTSPRDLRAAAWLLESGANLAVANRFLQQPLTQEQRQLYLRLVDESVFYPIQGYNVLIACVSPPAYVEELSTLVHKLTDLYDPDAAFLLAQFEDSIQLVARSRADAIDVGEIAREFHGGGHSRASAALIQGVGIEDAEQRLLQLLREHTKPVVTVKDIMSRAVHTLTPDTSVAEADSLMRRYSHEGFPVVSRTGELLGILTRQEIDRALHHELGGAPIHAYMHKGGLSVSPHDSVTEVSRVMIEQGLGQVAVEDEGRFIGIVTRTDLIKLWSAAPSASRARQIADRMEEALPAPLRGILITARETANEMGYSLYIVGGFVRDLLLGTPTLDLDLVVEGDAIGLAKRLARITGGKVRGHGRFGTAKIILGGTAGTSLPTSLDFVTARREFYEHPTALPRVEHSSIKQDLYRRDFTINTMAICLDRDRYGELLDFYAGEKDLTARRIRVLHNLSFVEDPTRMLRAVRLEQRLGFVIEDRTAELIDDALGLLQRVTGERLRHELYAILEEKEPEMALHRLDQLGILSHVHPGLRHDGHLAGKFTALREAVEQRAQVHRILAFSSVELLPPGTDVPLERRVGQPSPADYLSLAAAGGDPDEVKSWLERLRITGPDARQITEVNELAHSLAPLQGEDLQPSEVYQLLQGYPAESLLVLRVATHSRIARAHLDLYLRKLRWVKLHVNGDLLKAMGLPTGPHYRDILTQLRNARLDGRVSTKEEEVEMARALAASMGFSAEIEEHNEIGEKSQYA